MKVQQARNNTVLTDENNLFPLAGLRQVGDIKTPDQPISYVEDVDRQSVGQEIAFEITDHLMHFDCDVALAVRRDLERLKMRIDDRPLTFPIAAHLITSVHVATLHSVFPNDIGVHGRENALDVAGIEEGIDSPEE